MASRPIASATRGIGRAYQIARPLRNLTLLENVAPSARFGQHGNSCWRRAEEALRLVGLPSDAAADTLGLGAAALKKLELARAPATPPRLLLADENLNGLEHAEMEQAADMLQRIRRDRNTTIRVEHIMGVLMRVVDRVVVLDHGERIFDGAPDAAQSDARVVEVYPGATWPRERALATRPPAFAHEAPPSIAAKASGRRCHRRGRVFVLPEAIRGSPRAGLPVSARARR